MEPRPTEKVSKENVGTAEEVPIDFHAASNFHEFGLVNLAGNDRDALEGTKASTVVEKACLAARGDGAYEAGPGPPSPEDDDEDGFGAFSASEPVQTGDVGAAFGEFSEPPTAEEPRVSFDSAVPTNVPVAEQDSFVMSALQSTVKNVVLDDGNFVISGFTSSETPESKWTSAQVPVTPTFVVDSGAGAHSDVTGGVADDEFGAFAEPPPATEDAGGHIGGIPELSPSNVTEDYGFGDFTGPSSNSEFGAFAGAENDLNVSTFGDFPPSLPGARKNPDLRDSLTFASAPVASSQVARDSFSDFAPPPDASLFVDMNSAPKRLAAVQSEEFQNPSWAGQESKEFGCFVSPASGATASATPDSFAEGVTAVEPENGPHSDALFADLTPMKI